MKKTRKTTKKTKTKKKKIAAQKKKLVKAPKKTAPKPQPPAKLILKPFKKTASAKPVKKIIKRLKKTVAKPSKVAVPPLSSNEMKIEEAKYYAGPSVEQPLKTEEIPQGYGDNRAVLLVRDSYWLFAYWEISAQRYLEVQAELGAEFDSSTRVLRVYDTASWDYFDITVNPSARDWYINVGRPNCDFCVDIGFKSPSGRFVAACRSNVAHTPRAGLSEIIDEEWMIPDWEKLYSLCGGFGIGHSLELREMIKRRLEENISSPGMIRRA